MPKNTLENKASIPTNFGNTQENINYKWQIGT